jgi:lysophospholipid acyltransferase (LPLAT)-like uncharacterized protein
MRINPIYTIPLITPILQLWYRSLRFKQIGYDQVASYRNREKGRVVLFALWHDELFAPLYVHRNQDVLILVSESRDGEFIGRILKRFGYGIIRGSSTRGGVKALKQILKKIKERPQDLAITIDGPTGPRHEVKEGIIYISWKLKIPIVPVRTKIFFKKEFSRSWDRFQLPLPGSKCEIIYDEPYMISSPKMNSHILKKEMRKLKLKMDSLISKQKKRL